MPKIDNFSKLNMKSRLKLRTWENGVLSSFSHCFTKLSSNKTKQYNSELEFNQEFHCMYLVFTYFVFQELFKVQFCIHVQKVLPQGFFCIIIKW